MKFSTMEWVSVDFYIVGIAIYIIGKALDKRILWRRGQGTSAADADDILSSSQVLFAFWQVEQDRCRGWMGWGEGKYLQDGLGKAGV